MTEQVNKWSIPELTGTPAAQNKAHLEQEKQQGFEQGYQQGMTQAKQENAQQFAALNQLGQNLTHIKQNLDGQFIELLEQYCNQVIKKVLHLELTQNQDALKSLIQQGVQQLSKKSLVKVQVHKTLLAEHADSLKQALHEGGIELIIAEQGPEMEITVSNEMQMLQSDLFALIDQSMQLDDGSEHVD